MGAFRTLALTVFSSAGAAHADVAGNLGFLSEYVFRGVPQADSVANGGLDFAAKGFYAGTWWADVGRGLEIDGYGGYARDVGAFRFALGYTGYFYTDDFDDTYQEINFRAGCGPFTFEHNAGRYANFAGPAEDYGYTTLSLAFGRLRATLGSFSRDFDGDFVQVGYATEAAGIQLGLDLIYSDGDLVGTGDRTTLVASASRRFALGGSVDGHD